MNTYECTVNPEFERQSLLKFFLRDGIEIYHSDRLNVTEIEFCNGNAKEIMAWDELLGYFYNEVEQYYLKNYDYCFLKNALIEAKECETIVVGSSYARFGIEEKILSKKAKNLSLPSQDIYYAAKISRHISNTNLSLKDVFIGCSYYYFYSDVSRSRSDSERKQVSDVYYPIFGDAHNALVLKSREEFSKSNVFDVGKIMETIERDIYSTVGGVYFTTFHKRSYMKIGVPLESCWKDITADEKEKAGKDRADAHNKCIKYKESYEENIRVLNELVSECNERGVRVWIVVMPMSESYKKYLNPEFEKQFYEALNRIDGEIHLIDFNVIDHNFSDEDFNDMDHLSEKGAIKVTEIINQTAYPK